MKYGVWWARKEVWLVHVTPALKIGEGWSGASRKRGAIAKRTNQMFSRPHLKLPHHSANFVARSSCTGGYIRRYASHTLSYVDDCCRTKVCRFQAVVTLTAPLDLTTTAQPGVSWSTLGMECFLQHHLVWFRSLPVLAVAETLAYFRTTKDCYEGWLQVFA